jgi:lipoyl(octanoyl) transferase
VTLHGFSINVDPELSHFSGIVPCGLAAYPVTSLVELGVTEGRERLDLALQQGLDQFLVSLREGNVKA